jgi:hypothetical protein
MARISIAVCDRCGTKDEKANVLTWAVRRLGDKMSGELCDKCWSDLRCTYQPTATPRGRHQIVVVDPKKVARKRA